MANLSVRNVDDVTAQLLRERAASHGVSMEEEARLILRAAVMAPPRLGDVALQSLGPSTDGCLRDSNVRAERPAWVCRMILLDTNVVSELVLSVPTPRCSAG